VRRAFLEVGELLGTLGTFLEGVELEPLMVVGAAGTLALVTRPQSAPGPSDELLARERRARQALSAAEDELALARAHVGTREERKARRAAAEEELRRSQAQLAEIEALVEEAYADLQAYPVPEYLAEAYAKGSVMVGVAGASGVGKSTWINAIRRMTAKDTLGAKTGVTETTGQPRMYEFNPGQAGVFRTLFRNADGQQTRSAEQEAAVPMASGDRVLLTGPGAGLRGQSAEVLAQRGAGRWEVELTDGQHVVVEIQDVAGVLADCVIWDLPGVGTPSHPAEDYIRQMGIRHFDIVLIMTSSRFTKEELRLVDELRDWQVPFFLVRTQVDVSVQAEIDEEEEYQGVELGERSRKAIEVRTIASIKEFFAKEFGLQDVYCISARPKFRSRFEFLQLERDMEATIKRQRVVKEAARYPLGKMWADWRAGP